MLRRVAAADDDLPFMVADPDPVPVVQPVEGVGKRVQAAAKAAEAGAVGLHRILVPAGGAEELDGLGRRLAAGVGGQRAAGDELQAGDPEPALELAREPAGLADVVRMHVGDEHARHRPAAQRPFQRCPPGGLRLGAADPGVDDRPPVTVLDRPGVDEGQRPAERHAEPADARRDLNGLADLRPVLEGVDQLGPLGGPDCFLVPVPQAPLHPTCRHYAAARQGQAIAGA